MTDPYSGREQTKAKHFILKRYLQALAFKVLTFSEVTYIDGFSGPWQTKTEDFSDSSFMIAISVLQDAQKQILERKGNRPRIRCFFSEIDAGAFTQLQQAVAPFHKPEEGFEIKTFCGKFEDAVSEIQTFIGASFPLIFIDPTGWTGYPLIKIKPLFERRKLGRPNWPDRLDTSLPRGLALEKLFRETLKSAGNFDFVISTKIDKATTERPHFFITYGTKSPDGLITFRQTEYDALRQHAKNRVRAKEKKREEQTGISDLFAGHQADVQEATIDEIVTEQKELASDYLMASLPGYGLLSFSKVVTLLLQPYMLRETNVKDICVELARAGRIESTWGGGNRKPRDDTMIRLATDGN